MKICEQVTYCERLPGSLLGSGESQTGQGSSQERVEFHLWKLGQGPANYGLGVQGWPTTHVLWSMSYKWLWIFKCEAPQPHLILSQPAQPTVVTSGPLRKSLPPPGQCGVLVWTLVWDTAYKIYFGSN